MENLNEIEDPIERTPPTISILNFSSVAGMTKTQGDQRPLF